MINDDVDVRSEYVLRITGVVRERPDGTLNENLPTGGVEIGDCEVEVLRESHIELNRRICRQSKWGADEIDERGRALATRAVRLWPRPERPGPLAGVAEEVSD